MDSPATSAGREWLTVKTSAGPVMRCLSRLMSAVRAPWWSGGPSQLAVPYQPTPKRAVRQMLRLAGVHQDDVVYDLGSGDGRVPIAASQLCGARAVGIEIDPRRIKQSLRNARNGRVLDRVTFRHEDLFKADISDATVVILFLWPEVNIALLPKLRRELKPGTRVVSYCWEIGDWAPDEETAVDGHPLYLWTIPARSTRARHRPPVPCGDAGIRWEGTGCRAPGSTRRVAEFARPNPLVESGESDA